MEKYHAKRSLRTIKPVSHDSPHTMKVPERSQKPVVLEGEKVTAKEPLWEITALFFAAGWSFNRICGCELC